jgi:hypothetical protein
MRRICCLLILLCITQVTRAQSFPPPGNLIVNGDFEGGFSGWQGTYGLLTTSAYPLNPAPLSGMTVGVVLAGQDSMTQTIPTTIGVTYEITLNMRLADLGGNGTPIEGDSGGNPGRISVIFGGQVLDQVLVQNRTTWNSWTYDFVAQSDSSQLALMDPQSIFQNHTIERAGDVFFDNVSIVPIPEPVPGKLFVVFAAIASVLRMVSGRQPPPARRKCE